MKKLLIIFLSTITLLSPKVIHADEVNIGEKFFNRNITTFEFSEDMQLSLFINPIIWNIYVFAGIIIFFVLLYGGFLFIMGASSGDEKKLAQSKQALTWGMIGLIVVFSSFWIIQIVQIFTGLNILNPDI